MSTPAKLVAAAAAITIVAAFLPWASVLGVTARGIDGDGQLTLVLGLIGLGLVGWRMRGSVSRLVKVTQAVLGGCVALIAVADMNGFSSSGIYLTLLAGLGWVAAAFLLPARSVPTTDKAE